VQTCGFLFYFGALVIQATPLCVCVCVWQRLSCSLFSFLSPVSVLLVAVVLLSFVLRSCSWQKCNYLSLFVCQCFFFILLVAGCLCVFFCCSIFRLDAPPLLCQLFPLLALDVVEVMADSVQGDDLRRMSKNNCCCFLLFFLIFVDKHSRVSC
jgi:hypothetical protein